MVKFHIKFKIGLFLLFVLLGLFPILILTFITVLSVGSYEAVAKDFEKCPSHFAFLISTIFWIPPLITSFAVKILSFFDANKSYKIRRSAYFYLGFLSIIPLILTLLVLIVIMVTSNDDGFMMLCFLLYLPLWILQLTVVWLLPNYWIFRGK